VLAPERDIDGYYLGKEAAEHLRAVQPDAAGRPARRAKPSKRNTPKNISGADFRKLQKRLLSSALAFAVDDSSIQNNVSTVILIEWGCRRLLFVGDAEWKGEYRKGRKNGSWNVMWNRRRDDLSSPVDFLKVGHHGSHNATPWNRHEDVGHEVNQILDAILPLPAPGEKPSAQCVVSTKRKQYDTIPDGVANTRTYLKEFEEGDSGFDPHEDIANYSVMKSYSNPPSPRQVGDEGWLDLPQPPRTDMESEGKGSETMIDKVEFIDVEIEP